MYRLKRIFEPWVAFNQFILTLLIEFTTIFLTYDVAEERIWTSEPDQSTIYKNLIKTQNLLNLYE